jgi:flagellar assembly protein FliH
MPELAMKPLELRLPRPLRNARVAGTSPYTADPSALREVEERAFERGRQQGEKQLSEQLIRQRSEMLELQNGVLESMRQMLPQLARECEKTLVTLALQVAEKLVAGLPISPELVEATVREALARVEDTSEMTVLLHPDDLQLLQQINSQLLGPEFAGQRLHLRPGSDIGRGGCVVQTRFGLMDARRETKLEVLRKSLEV